MYTYSPPPFPVLGGGGYLPVLPAFGWWRRAAKIFKLWLFLRPEISNFCTIFQTKPKKPMPYLRQNLTAVKKIQHGQYRCSENPGQHILIYSITGTIPWIEPLFVIPNILTCPFPLALTTLVPVQILSTLLNPFWYSSTTCWCIVLLSSYRRIHAKSGDGGSSFHNNCMVGTCHCPRPYPAPDQHLVEFWYPVSRLSTKNPYPVTGLTDNLKGLDVLFLTKRPENPTPSGTCPCSQYRGVLTKRPENQTLNSGTYPYSRYRGVLTKGPEDHTLNIGTYPYSRYRGVLTKNPENQALNSGNTRIADIGEYWPKGPKTILWTAAIPV